MRALVTGAARGLGRALTEDLLNSGYEVVAVDFDVDVLDDLELRSRGSCVVRMAELSNPDSIDRLMDGIAKLKFDLVILNAGISATGKFEDIPSAAYARLLAVNLTAPLRIASAMVGAGFMTKKSKIIFISSLSHVMGYPGASVYAASKDALASYAKSVRKPFKKQGVGVLTVFPGPIRTDQADRHAPADAKAEKRMEPSVLARKILRAARSGAKELYPGAAAVGARYLGWAAPGLATKIMRKQIFEKLDEPTY